MPEGDTLARIARTMAPVLVGRTIVRWESPLAVIARAPMIDKRIDAVEALGKNLLIRFEDGQVLRTHLRMDGSWHLYHPGDRWKRGASHARVVLGVDVAVAVCFDAPVVELLSANAARVSPALASLGPDVLGAEFDLPEVHRRFRARDDIPLGEAILDQRVLAGVGNVYKSEVLFVKRADPFLPVARTDDAALDAIVLEARRIMMHNVTSTRHARVVRRDAPGERLFVYGRNGRPCYVCSTLIEVRRQGTLGRTTYFCRKCQHVVVRNPLARTTK